MHYDKHDFASCELMIEVTLRRFSYDSIMGIFNYPTSNTLYYQKVFLKNDFLKNYH